MLRKWYIICMVSAMNALAGTVDLSKFSPDDIYLLGDLAHEEGDFDLSVHLMQMVAPRGRSIHLIDLHALRTQRWEYANNYHSPDYWWHENDITNKRVFIKHDGGAGDAIQFLRYAKKLHDAGAYVMIETPPALTAIYSFCPYIDQIIPHGSKPTHADITLTLSTPALTYTMRNELEQQKDDVPYIYANPVLVDYWKRQMAEIPGKKIGLCWCSSPLYNGTTGEKQISPRSIPLELFQPILSDGSWSVISLQCGFGVEQLNAITHGPLVFEDIDTTHGRFMDTMAIMQNLDLVITVDTSIAHIAGALGVPVWMILPKCSDFRWFTERTDSVWYPTMRIFRQKPYDEWHTVLHEVFTALKEFCA